MDEKLKKVFDVDPQTGAYIPKPITKEEVEKQNKNKITFLQDKYKYYLLVQKISKFLKRVNLKLRLIVYRITHPIEYIDAKITAFRLKRLTKDKDFINFMFEENINENNLKKMDDEL